MIPKIIHYCWFGRGKKSELIQRCTESWKKHLPDYEIIEWNEENFDVNICKYTKQAYEAKKWAFVADYARLIALQEYGGIYLDTDMELFKSFDEFLDNDFFAGFESKDIIAAGVIGAIPNNDIVEKLVSSYSDREFVHADGSLDLTANPHLLTEILTNYGFVMNGREQTRNRASLYPQTVFYVNDIMRIFGKVSPKAYSVHHGEKSWSNEAKNGSFTFKIRRYVVGLARNVIGTKRLETIREKRKISKRI